MNIDEKIRNRYLARAAKREDTSPQKTKTEDPNSYTRKRGGSREVRAVSTLPDTPWDLDNPGSTIARAGSQNIVPHETTSSRFGAYKPESSQSNYTPKSSMPASQFPKKGLNSFSKPIGSKTKAPSGMKFNSGKGGLFS